LNSVGFTAPVRGGRLAGGQGSRRAVLGALGAAAGVSEDLSRGGLGGEGENGGGGDQSGKMHVEANSVFFTELRVV